MVKKIRGVRQDHEEDGGYKVGRLRNSSGQDNGGSGVSRDGPFFI